ncbi:hypothetical protein [Sebaldella termitidis]|uniref:hypothetical protein n=1 Tax=Sebaldella termitidis TaxID=826 RepID=UPI003EBDB728
MLGTMNNEYMGKLKAIKKHFGEINQKAKLLEELEELQDALDAVNPIWLIKKSDDDFEEFLISQWDTYKKGVLEEIADCYVIAYQIDKASFLRNYIESLDSFSSHLIYQNTRNARGKVAEIMRFKIDRTLERIESGYYEPDICPICEGAGGIENTYDGHFFNCKACNGTGKVERKEK